jgi:hypothetical protein
MVSVCLSVWTKIGQCLEDSSSHCPFPVVTNRAGQGGQGSRCGGAGRQYFLRQGRGGQGSRCGGPGDNFFFKIIFIIEHIKKTRIFLKKKIEK